ncbi:MAG: adenine phosphoribosyltransferase [Bdellovibrionales bacterium]|jgi:adenine phosphoribosyltransferase
MPLDLKAHIRSVPGFPKEGILFYDIGTLLGHGPAWQETIDRLEVIVREDVPDFLIAVESRGFLVAAPLAARLGIGLIMVRKKGKLPGKTQSYSYELEYGTDTLEIQEGLITVGQRGVIIDDLLATGGTTAATIHLARQMGVDLVRAVYIIELPFLNGRQKIDIPVSSLLSYDE